MQRPALEGRNNMKNPFESLNAAIKKTRLHENRRLRHTHETEIIETAMANLSQSEMGAALVEFIYANNLTVSILRGRYSRDYAPSDDTIFLSVSSDAAIDDPAITIHMAGAIRETAQEHDNHLRRVGVDHGESIYVHREGQKFEDKLFWQTGIVYELGVLGGRTEFIDSFTLMGYSSLIDAYAHDLETEMDT